MPKRGTLSNKLARKTIQFKSEWHLDKGYKKYINWYKNLYFKK